MPNILPKNIYQGVCIERIYLKSQDYHEPYILIRYLNNYITTHADVRYMQTYQECEQCGGITEYAYDDEELKERGCIFEFCMQENEEEKLIALDIL